MARAVSSSSRMDMHERFGFAIWANPGLDGGRLDGHCHSRLIPLAFLGWQHRPWAFSAYWMGDEHIDGWRNPL